MKYVVNLLDIIDDFDINLIIIWPIKLNVELIERKNNKMKSLSYMFYEISTLQPTSNFDGFDSINIETMNKMFYNCASITKLPDISKLNISNVTDMSHMFYNCSSIKQLPDISKWTPKKLLNINSMFKNCKLLTSIPDISHWFTNGNILNMNDLIKNCESLESLPDLPGLPDLDIEKEPENHPSFESSQLLEEELNKTNQKENNIFQCLECSLNKICCCC